MKTATIQVSIKEAVAERVSIKFGNECTNYQEYEAYEDHVDSFVLNYSRQGEERNSSMPQEFARKAILRRVKSKMRQQVFINSYGESLYGDHVDSPSYDDYLEYNSGDNE